MADGGDGQGVMMMMNVTFIDLTKSSRVRCEAPGSEYSAIALYV